MAFFRAKLLRPEGTPSDAVLFISDSTLIFSSLMAAVLDLHEKRPALPKMLKRALPKGNERVSERRESLLTMPSVSELREAK